ncbi:MAG TPA: SGNH/GDSL hydrolase family protein [Candidatus Binatia bacterium]|nr:SGNH/GDSL hydrolase family protein [Candidatus Binatia bacterium]
MIARIALALAGVLLALALCEGFLRMCWCGPERETYEYQSAPFLCANPYWGAWHLPNHSVEHRTSCFDAHYTTNEYGMKSDPLGSGKPRIALLGDSFVEGFGNDNATTVQRYLAMDLASSFEILNFGVSGRFTTIDELVIYDNFVRFFHPKIAVLFFLNYNDLRDSLEPDKRTLIDEQLNFVYRKVTSLEEVLASFPREPPPNPEAQPERLCLSRLWRVAELVFHDQVQMGFNIRWDIHQETARPYLPDEDADTRKAWAIVDASIARLAAITRSEGTTLVVVQIADPYQIDSNWLHVTSAWVRRPLDPTHPNRRLQEICERHHVRYYDMYPDALRAIEAGGLRFPYLSFRCNRHFSPQGQKLMADLVARYLRKQGLLDGIGSAASQPRPTEAH